MATVRSLLLTLALAWPLAAAADAATQAFAAGREAYGDGDFKAAAEQWQRAASMDHAEAEFRLGALYEEGKGVPQDMSRAADWYRRAAEHGSEQAQFNLAHMYAKGQGVEKSEAKAAQWYRRSAERGNPHAQYALGLIYYRGVGVERDLVEAYAWLTVAIHNFDPNMFRDNANEVRNAIDERMTDAQRQAAEQRLDEWAAARD